MNFILKIQLDKFAAGSIVFLDPEWSEWYIGNEILGYRGSAGEGELAKLLQYAMNNKLETILEPFYPRETNT